MFAENTDSLVELGELSSGVDSQLEADDALVAFELEEHNENPPTIEPPTDILTQDESDEKCTLSSDSSSTSPLSGSPQLDKLICDLEEMKLMLTCSEEPISESTNEAAEYIVDSDLAEFECLTEFPSALFSPEGGETNQASTTAADQVKYEDLSDSSASENNLECPLMSGSCEGHVFGSEPTAPLHEEINSKETYLPATFNEVLQPEIHETSPPEESSEVISLNDSRADIQEDDSTSSFSDLVDAHKEESTTQEQGQDTTLHNDASPDVNQSWDLLHETVSPPEYFTFEEIMPDISLFDKQTDFSHMHGESADSADYDVSKETLVESKAVSTSDDDYNSPPSQQNLVPPEYSEVVQSTAHSAVGNDPDLYFDCTHVASESEDAAGNVEEPKVIRKRAKEATVLSSGSEEDYEDASFSHKEHAEQKQWDDSDEEFIMCEAAIAKMGEHEDVSEALAREVRAELGPMSESSDDEFLTTRIVRRRVVIKSDEMPDLSTPSVTEEKYTDENGHTIVKRVTRKVIRKCVSTDGAEQEEVPAGASQGSISIRKGDNYSKVVKRTVLKSEGDHTEVTFDGNESRSASKQATAGGYKVSQMEKTTVVKGERTMTQHGDSALASDLPSATEDFKQALSYLSDFTRAELPPVVERECVKEDGTVVRRAHMRKGRRLRRSVVKGSGQQNPDLADCLGKSLTPGELQQHLYQLFHHYYQKETDSYEEEEDE